MYIHVHVHVHVDQHCSIQYLECNGSSLFRLHLRGSEPVPPVSPPCSLDDHGCPALPPQQQQLVAQVGHVGDHHLGGEGEREREIEGEMRV